MPPPHRICVHRHTHRTPPTSFSSSLHIAHAPNLGFFSPFSFSPPPLSRPARHGHVPPAPASPTYAAAKLNQCVQLAAVIPTSRSRLRRVLVEIVEEALGGDGSPPRPSPSLQSRRDAFSSGSTAGPTTPLSASSSRTPVRWTNSPSTFSVTFHAAPSTRHPQPSLSPSTRRRQPQGRGLGRRCRNTRRSTRISGGTAAVEQDREKGRGRAVPRGAHRRAEGAGSNVVLSGT
jgi:hypothetical protein